MIDDASAVTAGGRRPEDVQDLVNRVGHGTFDLVIMNPPFTRQGGQEGERKGIGNAAFAAFETSRQTQDEMQGSLRRVSGRNRLGSGHAGMAAHFLDLGLRKARTGGVLAYVLPLSSMSGISWEKVRAALLRRCTDTTVVTISQSGSFDRSFSADTGMAECLLITHNTPPTGATSQEVNFVVLRNSPTSTSSTSILAALISRQLTTEATPSIRDQVLADTALRLGGNHVADIISAPVQTTPWQLVGLADLALAQVAYNLVSGVLLYVSSPAAASLRLPIVLYSALGDIGPYDLTIRQDLLDGTPQGPFRVISPIRSPLPSYPMIWNHDARKERSLTVEPDVEGEIKHWPSDQSSIDAKAARIWATATRAHYNRDLQFNAQSIIVAMTERKCIGGRAWPSVILHNEDHEYAFSLWCNSTLGLLLHWWVSNKTQAGRGTTTVTAIPNIPTLDTRALSDAQHAEARRQFDLLRDERFLPFDQIDEDPARARLDRAILVDVLGLPESLVEDGGPIDLIRRKLAKEPQIHGGKKSRVVFTDEGEKSVKRNDR